MSKQLSLGSGILAHEKKSQTSHLKKERKKKKKKPTLGTLQTSMQVQFYL